MIAEWSCKTECRCFCCNCWLQKDRQQNQHCHEFSKSLSTISTPVSHGARSCFATSNFFTFIISASFVGNLYVAHCMLHSAACTKLIMHTYVVLQKNSIVVYLSNLLFFCFFLYSILRMQCTCILSHFHFYCLQAVLGDFKLATLYPVQQRCKRTINSICIYSLYLCKNIRLANSFLQLLIHILCALF